MKIKSLALKWGQQTKDRKKSRWCWVLFPSLLCHCASYLQCLQQNYSSNTNAALRGSYVTPQNLSNLCQLRFALFRFDPKQSSSLIQMLAWSQRNEWNKYQETCKRGTFCALQKRGKNHFLWVNERAVLKTTQFHKNTTHATSIMLQPNIIAAPCLQHNKPIRWKAKSTCAAQKERKKKITQ